ncbi:MAG TPA: ABC transporter substrate-binding protein [Pseudonocardiaceae bacterium]|jgi:peptide/nickel transport system substrate-binding protein|nr:ABC transporter substrate-binding protein [Pseudonocardiaceae bacterium]
MFNGRRWLVPAATLTVLGALVAGCGSSNNAVGTTPQQGGTATWAELSGASPNWIFPFVDSAHNSVNSVLQFENLMYRPLYWFGNGNQPTLNENLSLAAAPTYENNNTTLVINLKPYVWSNGEHLTAQDVEFWMNMMFAEKANWANYVPGEFPDNVKSVTVNSPTQLTMTLDNTYSSTWFTGDELAQVTPMPMAWDRTSDSAAPGSGGCTTDRSRCDAVYQYLYDKSKNLSTYAKDPLWQVVDGPWTLKSFDTDGNVTMVPNKSYSGPVKPKLATFKELPFTSDQAEYNVLRGGNTINVGDIPITDMPQRSVTNSNPLPATNPIPGGNYTMAPNYVWGWSYAPINYANPTYGAALRQLYIRQALQMSIDQKTDDQVAWRGYSVPTTGPIPTAPPNQYVSDAEQGNGPYPFDVDRAKSLLTSHGWTMRNGVMTCANAGSGANQCGAGVPAGQSLHLTLEYANGIKSVDQIVQQFKSDASGAGIDIAINAQPFNTVISDTTSCAAKPTTCNWELALFGYETYGAVPTGDGLFLPGSAINYSSVNDPKLTELVGKTLHDSSMTTFHSYVDYAAQQLPGALNTPDSYFVFAYSRNMGGVAPFNPLGGITPENWYFTK